MADLTRMTINLNRQAERALDDLAAASGLNRTDVINAALVLARLAARMSDPEGVLTILRPDGTPVVTMVPHIPAST